MTVDITLLRTADQRSDQLGLALARAFSRAPDYSYILSGHPDKLAALAWFFGRFAARLALRCGEIHVSKDCDAGILVFRPDQAPSPWTLLRAGLLAFPRRFGWRATWRAFALGLRMEKRRLELAPRSHWYVLAVGVAPQKQGRGIGYDLLRRIIGRAESEGVACYLETFEDDLAAGYERRGFSVLKDENLPNGLRLRCMLRRPERELAPRMQRAL